MPAGRIGVRSRPLPDYYAAGLQSGRAFSAGVAAKQSEVVLFNNATDGTYLRVYGFTARTNVAGPILMEWLTGSFGALQSGANQAVQLDEAPGWGQIFTGANATCIGLGVLGIYTLLANTGMNVFSEFPLAVLPPNYSITMEGSAPNAFVDVTYFWLPTRWRT